MTKNYAIYHSPCYDGGASRFIMEQQETVLITEFIPFNHGRKKESEKKILEKCSDDVTLYFLDCCPTVLFFDELSKFNTKIFVLDHHENAVIKLKNRRENCENLTIIYNPNRSGCGIVAEYFKIDLPLPGEYFERGDIFNFDSEGKADAFTTGIKSYFGLDYFKLESEEASKYMKRIMTATSDEINECIKIGKKEVDRQSKIASEKLETPIVEINGLNWLILENPRYVNPDDTNVMRHMCLQAKDKHNIDVLCFYSPPEETCLCDCMIKLLHKLNCISSKRIGMSLRTTSDDVDVSQIARRFGGNGHKKASGCSITLSLGVFSLDELIFKLGK